MPYKPITKLREMLLAMKEDYPNELTLDILITSIIKSMETINPEKQKEYVSVMIQLGYLEQINPLTFRIRI